MEENNFKEDFFRTIGSEKQELYKDDMAPLVMHSFTNQITYVAKGKGFGLLGDEIQSVSEGDVLFIPKKTKHSFKSKGDVLVLYHYHWPREFLDEDRLVLQEDMKIG